MNPHFSTIDPCFQKLKMPSEVPYCGITLPEFGELYRENMHGCISITICFIGSIFNLLNLLVFTRKAMISPVNLIFTHSALVDFLVLLARIPFVWMLYIQDQGDFGEKRTYIGTVFLICCDTFIVSFQFVSIFLTVHLATWRYIAVVHPFMERHWCNMKITRNVVIAGYIICCFSLGVPMLLSRSIQTTRMNQMNIYSFNYERSRIMFKVAFIVYGPIGRLFPSIVLAGFTFRIVFTLLARKGNRERLTQSASVESDLHNLKLRKRTNRSTMILLMAVVLFFIAEFPRGILSVLRVIYEYDEKSEEIQGRCYASLVQIFTTLTDINLSITFIVYYILSQQFRLTFKLLLSIKIQFLIKKISLLGSRTRHIEELRLDQLPDE
ncbi:G-protein coupled receptor dmsr-1-like [Planococcus citri]|uniref:G-protein coupled receptor dmsr-1-like n=1 Tax=Planococcus citri TaxID=170843 RepID=UPI0031F7560E